MERRMAITKSPKYPNFSLRQAIKYAEKIFKEDRRNPIDRSVAVKHMGYTSVSGASDKALGTMAQYGLLERTGKGELKISQLAVDIMHPDNPGQYKSAVARAAFGAPLFKALKERFPDGVSPDALRSYLVRENFLDRAVNPIIAAFTDTCAFLKQEEAFESGGNAESEGPDLALPDDDDDDDTVYGGARLGDLIQWESQGALQFEKPKRVRLVTDDGQWVVVEDSEAGIPMSEVIVQERSAAPLSPPPRFPLDTGRPAGEMAAEAGEEEWIRNKLGAETKVRVLVTGEMGPKQIGKLITLLKAQRAVLEDNDDEEADED
jgi:hypothetical protein